MLNASHICTGSSPSKKSSERGKASKGKGKHAYLFLPTQKAYRQAISNFSKKWSAVLMVPESKTTKKADQHG